MPTDDLAARNAVITHLVALLSTGSYEQVAAMAPTSRVNAAQMRGAIEQYGRSLIPLPAHGCALIDYVPINGNSTGWSVVVPLFTREEGRSDLSLTLSMVRIGTGAYAVQVDDIRVL